MKRLHQFVFGGNLEMVKEFVLDGDNINEKISLYNKYNELVENITPLYIASQQGYEDIFSFLMINGADCFIDAYNTKRKKYYSIESTALLQFNLKIAKILLFKKNVDTKKEGIYAPLIFYEKNDDFFL